MGLKTQFTIKTKKEEGKKGKNHQNCYDRDERVVQEDTEDKS